MRCSYCNVGLENNHVLEDADVVPMSNKSRIIYPKCSSCGNPILLFDVKESISSRNKVLLISGTAACGKSSLGQLIEKRSNYIFIDGDAVSKRVNHYRRKDPTVKIQGYGQFAVIDTMLVLLGLGYNVVVGYVINRENLQQYLSALSEYGITPLFRVLVPDRQICIERSIHRECWTTDIEWIDKWYEEQRDYLKTHKGMCIDTSRETLEETFNKHFRDLL